MSNWQNDVKEFMRACDQVVGKAPGWPTYKDRNLAQDLIDEECSELMEGLDLSDFPKTVDGCIDLIYVTLGLLSRLGVDAQALWDEVHRANMSKVGGPVLPSGKRGKPEGFTPPDIEGQLRLQGWEG